MGDVLYKGTPEKCRELMKQLKSGELTEGDVKELYAKAQEQTKDAGTVTPPDPTISTEDMKQYGYTWDGMLPLQETAALNLFENEDMQIFRLYGDGSENIAHSAEDIKSHAEKGGIMGIHKEDWEALREYREMKQELADSAPEKEALLLYGKEDAFGIYQLKDGAATRDLHFEPYDRLQASGNAVDPANYGLIYTAPLAPETSLVDIYIRFNTDHPKDFKGYSLSISDVIVLHQSGKNTAHYVDSGAGFRQVPEFLQPPTQQKELAPDDLMTGETVKTPRGSFHLTAMSREQMEAAGYGLHHQSDDGKYLIMGNGTRAFAVAAEQPEKANPLKHIEDTVEQNDNNFDGIINNTPTVDELEAKVKAGEQISLATLAGAIRADKERAKEAKPEKKPSIRAQLKADKEKTQKKSAKTKYHDLEV